MFAKKQKNTRRSLADQQTKRNYSYYSNTRLRGEEQPERARLNQAKDRQPKTQNWWHHVPSIFAIIAILICLGYILSVNGNPKVVQISGSQSIFLQDKDTYQVAANKLISKSILNKNKVTIDVAGISRELQAQFPELSNVSITIPIINRRPVIYVTASQPAMVLITQDNSTVIDSRGVAILPSYQVKDLTKYKLPTVKDDSGLLVETGKPVLPSGSAKFITDTAKQLAAESIVVDQFVLPAVPNELDVKLAGQKYYLKMDMQGNSREAVGAYKAALAKLKALNSLPNQYIDVRVTGRVFYR